MHRQHDADRAAVARFAIYRDRCALAADDAPDVTGDHVRAVHTLAGNFSMAPLGEVAGSASSLTGAARMAGGAVLGGIAAFATFYEMPHGPPAVQRDIYQTPWFAFLLGLLGVNVFSVMVSRWPWTKHLKSARGSAPSIRTETPWP